MIKRCAFEMGTKSQKLKKTNRYVCAKSFGISTANNVATATTRINITTILYDKRNGRNARCF